MQDGTTEDDAIELDSADGDGGPPFAPAPDPRPRMPEPLPVRLVSIDDVRLRASAGLEAALDAFYVGLLGFEREGAVQPRRRTAVPLLGTDRAGPTPPPLVLGIHNREDRPEVLSARATTAGRTPASAHGAGDDHAVGPVYRADNFRLSFEVVEGPVERDGVRVQGIAVPSLAGAEAKLIEAEVEYARQRGLLPGQESLLLTDPAGNWVELVEMRAV